MKHRWIANLDLYRKVPIDLLEGSKQGSFISWIALLVIFTLFSLETKEFFTNSIQTDLALDTNHDAKLRVNFNITMMDLPCQFAAVNVFSVFSGKKSAIDVSKDVAMHSVDANLVKQQAMISRSNNNKQQNDRVELHDASVTESLDDMIESKQRTDAVNLTPNELRDALKQHDFVFVDFFASWCSHCQVLAPTWEKLAEVIRDAAREQATQQHGANHFDDYAKEEYEAALLVHYPVLIAKVDCVQHHSFCMEQQIMGYPTLRLFVYGAKETDYHGHRSILAMTQFVKFVEERHKDEQERRMGHTDVVLLDKMNLTDRDRQAASKIEQERHQQAHVKWNADEHPGCQLSGFLMMDRAPGHFYIQAQSPNHDLAPSMTNLSHRINHLSFGDEKAMEFVTGLIETKRHVVFPKNFHHSIQPLDDSLYVTERLHESYHHYLKLVATNVLTYRVVPSTQLATYLPNAVPEAKFILDLSPIGVTYRPKVRRWYDYITSIMAIVGGTFTILGLLEAGIRQAAKPRKRLQPKPAPPPQHRHAY